jgi:hypothetical protein
LILSGNESILFFQLEQLQVFTGSTVYGGAQRADNLLAYFWNAALSGCSLSGSVSGLLMSQRALLCKSLERAFCLLESLL